VTNEQRWDLIVIGTGGAAMAAGIEARDRGRTVLLVEHDVLGGTCLNVGCVPSKRLLAASGHRHAAATNPFPAAPTSAAGVDLPALIAQKQDLIDALREAKYQAVADAHDFPIRYGHARFTDENTLDVAGEQLTAPAFLVATGSTPAIPDLPGIETVPFLTSTTAMQQTELPESLVVLGAGPVGLEQSQLWSQLGVRVTIVGRFAPHNEPELAAVLKDVFTTGGITVVEQHATAVADTPGAVTVTTDGGQTITAQRLLVATGRRPNTNDLGLDAAGLRPTTADSWLSMTTSAPATSGSGPPGTSPAPRSTSTSPPRPGTSRPRTPWANRRQWTTAGCPASRSPPRSSPAPASPSSRPWTRVTAATAGPFPPTTSPARWRTTTPAAR